jgi:hypothetical protein
MNELHARKGLHVVSLYAQVHELEAIETIISRFSIEYPIAMDGFWEAGYQAPLLPRIWVVGADGKIKWVGRSGYEEALEEEMKKVKHPGLNLSEVHAEVEPVVKAFTEGRYAEAYKLADKLSSQADAIEAEDQALHILNRIDDRIGSLIARAEMAEILKDYGLAIRCWEALKAYKGIEEAEIAEERLEKLKDNEEVERNIKAQRDLLATIKSLDMHFQSVNDEDPDAVALFRLDCLRAYQAFAREHQGTGAAERATDLANTFKQLLGIE